MALGEKFKFKDVLFDGRIDPSSKKIIFVLHRIGGSEYTSVELKLQIPEKIKEDVMPSGTDKMAACYSRVSKGICFRSNCGTIKSPHSIDRLANFLAISLTSSFKKISAYETEREVSLSSNWKMHNFPDRMSKWFSQWCTKKIKEKIYGFVGRGCSSLLGFCNFDDLERQRFFVSAFSASNWDNLMTLEVMDILNHEKIQNSDVFKSCFSLPVSRKCLLDACYIDGKLLFRKIIISKAENFFMAIGENTHSDSMPDHYQYYDNWKSYLVMSDFHKDINLVERCIPFMKYNFSFCYLNSFQYMHPDSKIDSHLDFKTALSISSAIGDFYLRSFSLVNTSELREKFKDIYDQYTLDREGFLCKIHKAYSDRGSIFSGTVSDMRKSLPVYSAAWSNFLEEQIFVKDKPKVLSNNTLDEEMVFF